MDKYTMMSLCLMATFGLLILEVNAGNNPPAIQRMINCMTSVAGIMTNSSMEQGSACQKFNSTLGYCVNLYETAKPFYNSYEKSLLSMMYSLGYSIKGYFCHENSPCLPKFVKGEGPECFATQIREIGNCINDYLQVPLLEGFWGLAENDQKCLSFRTFGWCVIGHLDKCSSKEAFDTALMNIEVVKLRHKCKEDVPAPVAITIRPEEFLPGYHL
ncbi:uncharacterized protein [Drosophila bipectinata]|uniref:uncharacterized protein n=1 Tax=Drosophila bipectinata TaxID=42026 RepID=UPI001C894B5D|nr:uncharacterized protein LOC108130470 [Drosophila bipectinata]